MIKNLVTHFHLVNPIIDEILIEVYERISTDGIGKIINKKIYYSHVNNYRKEENI